MKTVQVLSLEVDDSIIVAGDFYIEAKYLTAPRLNKSVSNQFIRA